MPRRRLCVGIISGGAFVFNRKIRRRWSLIHRKMIILIMIFMIVTFYGLKTVDMKTSFGVDKQIDRQTAWTGLTFYGKLIYDTENENTSRFLIHVCEYRNQILAVCILTGVVLLIF